MQILMPYLRVFLAIFSLVFIWGGVHTLLNSEPSNQENITMLSETYSGVIFEKEIIEENLDYNCSVDLSEKFDRAVMYKLTCIKKVR